MTIELESQISTLNPAHPGFSKSRFCRLLMSWYNENKQDLPWRSLWSKFSDPYHVWVSEIMLQQTLIRVVIPVYERFIETFPTPLSLARASEDDVRKMVRGLGYYRRFRYLHKGVRELTGANEENNFQEDPDWQWPETFSEWKKVSGVGDYTAAAVSSICFDTPKGVVDGNVERVLCRVFDIRLPSNLPALKKRFQQVVDEIISEDCPGDFNQGLMEVGQHVCLPGQPNCDVCPVRRYCKANKNSSTDLAPAPKVKAKTTDVYLRLTILKGEGRYGLLRRPDSAKFLKETEGFLTEIKKARSFKTDGHLKAYGAVRHSLSKRLKHSITQHRIEAEVSVMALNKSQMKDSHLRWLLPEEVEENLISNLDRKAWKIYLSEHGSGL